MWVDPEFACGECGGTIARWPMTNLLRQEILDWRHKTVPRLPDGSPTPPHRAVLGTPVPEVARLVATEPEIDEGPVVIPSPEVPARPALPEELPGGAANIVKVAVANSWAVQSWFMRGPWLDSRGVVTRTASSVVLWMDRDGHRVVGAWSTDVQGVWKFEDAWSLTHQQAVVGSTDMRALLTAPRAVCEDCKEPPALHYASLFGPICWAERPSRGGTT